MKLNNFVKKYNNLRCTTEEDNDKILSYYNSIRMQSDISSIKFQREPDYFKQLKYVGPYYYTFIAEDKKGEADGGQAVVVRPCYVNGKMEHAAYMCDLRFRRDRITDFSWRDFSAEVVSKGEYIEEFKKCRFYYSSVIDTNHLAKKSFVHKSKRDKLTKNRLNPEYLAWYNMTSVMARMPWKAIKKKSKISSNLKITVSVAQEKDKKDLIKFLDEQNKKKLFGFVFNDEYNELERRFRDWDNFSLSSFFIARDESNKILGCFAPWDPSEGRKVILNQFPKFLHFLGKIMQVFGKKIPKKGSPLEILYLTHLELKHGLTKKQKFDVFNQLLDSLYESNIVKDYHFFSFADFFVDNLTEGIKKNYILQESPNAFFQVCTSETKKIFNTDDIKVAPGHEMVLA